MNGVKVLKQDRKTLKSSQPKICNILKKLKYQNIKMGTLKVQKPK